MTRLAESGAATQPPFDVVANELLHQFRAVRLEQSAYRLGKNLLTDIEPASMDESVDLSFEALGDFGFDGCHGFASIS